LGLSKRHSLPKDTFPDSRFDAAFGDHIDLAAEKILQPQPEPGVVQKAAPGLELNQEIDVALIVVLPTGHGAKDAHIAGAVPGGNAQNLLPAGFQQVIQIHSYALLLSSSILILSDLVFIIAVLPCSCNLREQSSWQLLP